MNSEEVKIKEGEDYITLNVLLKITNIISTGGMAKIFLSENVVYVNGEAENRRGRKLYPNDEVRVLNRVFLIK